MGIEDFHAHLDACKQCRENPFELCVVGGLLLVEATGPSKPYSMGTGRVPSEPALQNMPVRTELGKQIRDAFIRPLKTPTTDRYGYFHCVTLHDEIPCFLCDMGLPKRPAK